MRSRLTRWARGTFFGWWIVGGSIAIQVLVAGLWMQAFSTYMAVWEQEFGWSKTSFAVAFSLQHAQAVILSPFQGWMLKKFGPRKLTRAGLVLLGAGFMLLGAVDRLTAFYLVFMVMALGANLAGMLTLTTTIVSWFEARRSSALALMQIGIGLGGLLIPLVAWALVLHGWRITAVVSGAIILVAGLPIAQVMRGRPEDYGLLPYGRAPTAEFPRGHGSHVVANNSLEVDFTTRQALRTRAFWFLSCGHAVAVTVVSAVLVHLVVHLNDGLGFTLQTAAIIVSVMTAFTMVGQLAGGVLGDRFDKRIVGSVAMLGHAVALLAVTFATSLAWVVFFAVLHGLAWGLRAPVMQAMRADYFGRSSFATIMGLSFSIVMIGHVIGPVFAGMMADRFGDYRIGFTVLAVVTALGSLFFLLAKKPERT